MAQIVHTKINVQRKITSILLCQLCFNFLLYHTSKIQPLASNLKLISKILYEFIRTFKYFPIWIFVRIIFLIRIYSDVCSYWFFDTNIFKYSFVTFSWYKYIRIFVCIEINTNVTLCYTVTAFSGIIPICSKLDSRQMTKFSPESLRFVCLEEGNPACKLFCPFSTIFSTHSLPFSITLKVNC